MCEIYSQTIIDNTLKSEAPCAVAFLFQDMLI